MSALIDAFHRQVRERPDRPLVYLPALGAEVTATHLWRWHGQFRDRLHSLGIREHHLIVSLAGNRAASLALTLAARSHAAALMPLDAGTTHQEARDLAIAFGATAVVLPTGLVGGQAHVALDDELSLVTVGSQPATTYPGVAVLKLTSGSTGRPKAALATESQLMADSGHIIEGMGIAPHDTQIAAIPLSHAYGFGNLVVPLFLQGTAMVLRESFVPHQLPSDAARFGARVFPGVPFMFEYFIANPPAGGWPAGLQLLISAGARLEPAVARGFHERFGVTIHSFYGTTEAGGIAYDAGRLPDAGDGVGRPLPGVTIALRPDDSAPPGTGRVHVQSEGVSMGYAGGDGGDDGFVDGGFLTADYGRMDESGRLVLAGRASSFVNVAGRKVQPDEVERVLRGMPGVTDVRVLGAPDPHRGQQLVAVMVASDLSVMDVRRYCAARLSPHKIPRQVIFVRAMPVTPRGKTDRRSLDALVQAYLGRTS